jgi:hypothetical protein
VCDRPLLWQDAGDKLTALSKKHITIAVELITAARTGGPDKFAREDDKWTKNFEEIATFLSGANPNGLGQMSSTC